MELIRCENVTFAYPVSEGAVAAPPVLQGISLSIDRGEFVAVLGHNGSGKSTLAKHFNAILVPTAGRVLVDGIDTKEEERLLDIRRRVGMVFQNPDNQIVATVVEEDVAFALENLGVPPQEIRLRVDEALAAVGMSEYKLHAPHQLSGGQKQRVAIAGIIAMRPDCIVLDEPTAMLDPQGRKEVMEIIGKLHREGITILLITHFMEEAAKADRVVILDEGRVVLDGTPAEVFRHREEIRAVGLDVPFAVELAHRLRKRGLEIPENIISTEEMVDYIACRLK